MRSLPSLALFAGCILAAGSLVAQSGTTQAGVAMQGQAPAGGAPPAADVNPVPLDWVPPALADLGTMAGMKESFTLDRTMLALAAGVLPADETQVRQSINKLDGVSVHMLRFGETGVPDERAVDSIRETYHLRGWKHVVTSTNSGGPVHNNTSDVWVVMDGINIRGAVFLAETPKSLTLVTVAGTLSPVDLLHLRGHFGIPKFDGNPVARMR
jgi:hypothetical protein